jgi:hypothetical protein
MAIGCGAGAFGKAVATAPTVDGTVRLGGTRPLLVDWGPSDRTLLNTSREKGPLVIRFHDGVLEPLFNCHAKGKYAYAAERSMQVQDDIIESADELRAKMPAFGVKFEGDLQRAGKLHVRMKVVGMYSADQPYFRRADLQGVQAECDSATAVASHITVGAFRLYTLSRGKLNGDVAVGTEADVGGESEASEQDLNEAGDDNACGNAVASDTQPPDGCTTSLQLVLSPLQEERSPQPVPVAETPALPMRTTGVIVSGVGVASLVVGGVFGGLTFASWDHANSECPSHSGCSAQASSDRSNALTFGTISNVGFIAGGVLLAGGLTLYFTAPKDRAPNVGIEMAPGRLGVAGRF